MAGTLTIDTLKASSGVLATQNGMTGIAKAWILYNSVAQTITGSFNVSSVTYNGTGDFTINFTTAMPNATYSAVGMSSDNNGGTTPNVLWTRDPTTARTTTAIRLGIYNLVVGATNSTANSVAVFSS